MTYNKGKRRGNGNGLFFLALGLFLLITIGLGYGFYSWMTASPNQGVRSQQTATPAPAPQRGSEGLSAPDGKNVAAEGELKPVNGAAAASGTDYHLLVDKKNYTLTVFDAQNKVVKTYGVALGKKPGQKKQSGDMTTPDGTFPIAEVDDASSWTHDFGDGKGEIKGAYGNWFLYLDTSALSKGEWDGIGIHGTHDPASVGTRASEGCIRLHNEDIDELKAKYARVGTLVTIQE